MLILLEKNSSSVPNPEEGKSTLYIDTTGNLSVKNSDGNLGGFSGTVNVSGNSIIDLNTVEQLRVGGGSNGYVLTTDGNKNLSWQPGGGSGGGAVFVTSNITAVVAGAPLFVVADYGNTQYPGGVFTITQNTPPAPGNITMNSTWSSGGTSKNAYTDFANSIVNTQNITINLNLSNGAQFDVQSTDTITVGAGIVTGANLLSLGISGAGGSYSVPAAMVPGTVQTATTTSLSTSLTTSGGVKTATSNPLTTVAPTLFSVGNISGTFGVDGVPYWEAIKPFTWTASNILGTVTGGTVTLSGTESETLTTTGQVTGNSSPYNGTTGTYTLTGSYQGIGLNGAGGRTSNVTGNVPTVTAYTPLLYKINSSNANPTFTTNDSYVAEEWIPNTNQGANSPSTPSQYLWFAVPGPSTTPVNFKFDQPPFIGITLTKDPNLTFADQDIAGQTYQVYGFDQFSQQVFVYTTN